MPHQITGKIEVIGATVGMPSRDGVKTFYRRELVLDCTRYNPDTGEPWENHPRFELSGNNCGLLDQFAIGQRVTVDFSLRGTKYQDSQTGEVKYFTTINAFKIQLAQEAQQQQQTQQAPVQKAPVQQSQAQTEQKPSPQTSTQQPKQESGFAPEDENDGLPF